MGSGMGVLRRLTPFFDAMIVQADQRKMLDTNTASHTTKGQRPLLVEQPEHIIPLVQFPAGQFTNDKRVR